MLGVGPTSVFPEEKSMYSMRGTIWNLHPVGVNPGPVGPVGPPVVDSSELVS